MSKNTSLFCKTSLNTNLDRISSLLLTSSVFLLVYLVIYIPEITMTNQISQLSVLLVLGPLLIYQVSLLLILLFESNALILDEQRCLSFEIIRFDKRIKEIIIADEPFDRIEVNHMKSDSHTSLVALFNIADDIIHVLEFSKHPDNLLIVNRIVAELTKYIDIKVDENSAIPITYYNELRLTPNWVSC